MANLYDTTINSFYLAYYGRPADPAGLQFWSQHLEQAGGDFSVIADAFANSDEAMVRFGADAAAERITDIYKQLFNRAPEVTGLDYWLDGIENGHYTLAETAMHILKGAQGSDLDLSTMRQQAAESFTAEVAKSGLAYNGYAAIEAARLLVEAIKPETSQQDIDAMVLSVAALAGVASTTPAVIDAISVGVELADLLDTLRGTADPVGLMQTLADVAKIAAGNPATLESLLRGGGMAKVLMVMPADATLGDLVEALAEGGLPAAIEVVYPPAPEHGGGGSPRVTVSAHETADGIEVTSSKAGAIYLVDTDGGPKTRVHSSTGGDAVAGVVTLGQQATAAIGTVTVTAAGGGQGSDGSGKVFGLGSASDDVFNGVQYAWGFDGDDTLDGTALDDQLSGGAGSDTISGGLGADLIDLGADSAVDTIVYSGAADTAAGVFADGGSTADMDRVTGAGAGDVVRMAGAGLTGAAVGHTTYLADASADNYAIVRGRHVDGTFIAGTDPSDVDYLIQWADGSGVYSVLLQEFGAMAPRLTLDVGQQSLTLTEAPASEFTAVAYALAGSPSALYLYAGPSSITKDTGAGSDGLSNKATFSLEDMSTGTAVATATDYTDGAPLFGIPANSMIRFDAYLPADLYKMSWQDDTFLTTDPSGEGYLAADSIFFAGGRNSAHVFQEGFTVTDIKSVSGAVTLTGDNKNEAFIDDGSSSAIIDTGAGMDVVADNGGTLEIEYGVFDTSTQDLILGFDSGIDKIRFKDSAAAAIDDNLDGLIQWADTSNADTLESKDVVTSADEAIEITNFNTIIANTASNNSITLTLKSLNDEIDVTALQQGDELLILACDDAGGALFNYVHGADNIIDKTELTLVGTFSGGAVTAADIILTGLPV